MPSFDSTPDLDFMLKDSGVLVADVDGNETHGIVDEFDEQMLTDGVGAVSGRNVRILLRYGALDEVVEGTQLIFNGGVYRVTETRRADDGKLLEVFVVFVEAHVEEDMGDTIKHPFTFPFPQTGRMLTGFPISPLVGPLTNGASLTIFNSPVGTRGVIRNINVIVSTSLAGNPAFPGLTLEIRYDGESTPSVSIPLVTCFGMDQLADQIKDLEFDTPAFEVGNGFFQTEDPGIIRHLLGHFKLPIPFTNGIDIKVKAAADARIETFFGNVTYQNELDPAAWNSKLRLLATRSNESLPAPTASGTVWKLESVTSGVATSGTFPSTIVGKAIQVQGPIANTDYIVLARPDSTHITVDEKETKTAVLDVTESLQYGNVHTFLNLPSTDAGYIALIVGSHNNDAQLMEGNVRFYLDGNVSPDLHYSSVEDMFGGAFFFVYPNQNREGGVTSDGFATAGYAYYKNYWDNPIKFSAGIRGVVPHAFGALTAQVNWTTFYYKMMP